MRDAAGGKFDIAADINRWMSDPSDRFSGTHT
jgi:hypothetical protein